MFKHILKSINCFCNRIDNFLTPGKILSLGGIIGGVLILSHMLFCTIIYRDVACCYAYYAGEWGKGIWNSAPIAFLPPLNIFLGGLLVRLGMEAYSALILISGLFYLLTIFPLNGILKRFTTAKIAAYGCLFYLLAPKIIRNAGMGMLESGRDFFLILSLYLLFKIKDQPGKWYLPIFFGLSTGLLSLSRGEGIVFAGILFLCLLFVLFYKIKFSWNYFLLVTVRVIGIIAISFLVITSPRLVENYRNTGYPVLDSRAINLVNKIPVISSFFVDKRPQLWGTQDALTKSSGTEVPYTIGKQLLKVRKDFFRGAYELYLALGVIGVVVLLKRRQWRYEYTILAVTALAILPMFTFVVSAHRYYIYVIPVTMIFTITGLIALLRLLERINLRGIASVLLVILLALQVLNGMEMVMRNDVEYKFSMWLKKNQTLIIPEVAGRRPVIHATHRTEILYWLRGKRCYEFGEPMPPLSQATGFDFFVVDSDEEDIVEIMRKRNDYQEIDHPFSSIIILFAAKSAVGQQ